MADKVNKKKIDYSNKLVGSFYDYQANESIGTSLQIADTLKKCFIVFTIALPIIVIYLIFL